MRTTQEMEDIKFRDTIGDADIDSTIVPIAEKQQAEELKERKEKVKENTTTVLEALGICLLYALKYGAILAAIGLAVWGIIKLVKWILAISITIGIIVFCFWMLLGIGFVSLF